MGPNVFFLNTFINHKPASKALRGFAMENFMSNQLDHRQLADEMEIYFLNEEIGAGLPVWLPNGVAIRDALEAYIKKLEQRDGYQRVASPHVAKASLYEASGHLRAFQENMFPPMRWPEDNSHYYLKPMNCPHHHKVFSSSLRSYRQLPLRIAEYGQVYRYENSGALKGLSRVRGLCQNDAHIYVDPKEAFSEISKVLDLHEECYAALNLKGYRYRLSKHDPQRMKDFDGASELWQESEEILRQCLLQKGLPFFEAEGEAAFYGPKIDVQMKMGSGDEESIASVQLDFNSADKFDLNYVSNSGQNQRPWIIHRAPLGSHERFVALLLEYYQGQLPGWLSPVQVYLIPLNEEQHSHAQALAQKLRAQDIRVLVDHNSGSLSKRILFAHKLRPFSKIVLGAKELEAQEVRLQMRDGKEHKVALQDLEKFLKGVSAMP
ncbi:threonine--tRNA ligase [Bdellovibrio sp. HCB337]|uniref:threonine--tRNA ligase n=1 Tax=Bdellovibrio sp. HCB337 TaxID=3394358 RepID=UPI0039A59903